MAYKLLALALATAAGLAGCGGGARTVTVTQPASAQASSSTAPIETPSTSDSIDTSELSDSTTEPPTPNPEAKLSSTCDYVLGDANDDRLVADGSLRNTGNIGVKVRVTGYWRQAGQGPIKKAKTYRLAAGQTASVELGVNVGYNEISLLQAVARDRQCYVKLSIVGTFGDPQ